MIEELRKKQIEKVKAKKKKKKKIAFSVAFSLLIIIGVLSYFYIVKQNESFEVTKYELTSTKIEGEFKIVLMSDLHNKEFGDKNKELVSEIKNISPDLIIMCGDMVQKDEPDITVLMNLCSQLKDVADIFFVYGNHEGVLEYDPEGPQIILEKYLMEEGVTVCYPGEYKIIKNDTEIGFFSVSVSDETYKTNTTLQKQFKEFTEKDCFKIVASHYPEILYNVLSEENYDLGVAGHYHGGQIILPKLGGLYHADTGFFPKYYGGLYQLTNAKLIITRGLGSSSLIPRINNKPELVFIDINGSEEGGMI